MNIERGDIVIAIADIRAKGTSIQGGYRPYIIVSNDMCNKFSEIKTAVPLTSVKKKQYLPTHVKVVHDSLPYVSYALCEQVTCISDRYIDRVIGHIDNETMKQLEDAIKVQIGLV